MLDIKTTTKKLSIKITLIVFIFFVLTFCSLLFLHHYKFLYWEKQYLLSTVNYVKNDKNFFDNLLQNSCMWKCEKMKLLTRDFLVTKAWKVILSNWIYEMIDLKDFLKNNYDYWDLSHIHLWEGNNFYLIKEYHNWYDLYFTRDISFHADYERSLVYIFIVLSIFLSWFIYLLSSKLARITLEPLKSYNESLKLYNHHIAHELKTPLSVIKSELELLKLWYDKKILDSGLEEVNNMTTVIDSMLFLSENIVLNDVNDVNLSELVDEQIENFSNKNNKVFVKKTKSNKDIIISWDKITLKTMLKNLFENAIKYSKDDKIEVVLNKNAFEIINTFDWVIKEQEKNNLFDAFYKLNYNPDSYWLGLSIVKKIADLHWFKVDLEVKDNKFNIKILF